MNKYILTCIYPDGSIAKFEFRKLISLTVALGEFIELDEQNKIPCSYIISPQTSADYRREEKKR